MAADRRAEHPAASSGDVAKLLAQAASWDMEAERMGWRNPVFLRQQIRECRKRASAFRAQARMQQAIDDARRAA